MIDFNFLSSANEERVYDYLNNLANYQGCFCAKSYLRFINAGTVPSADIYINGNIAVSGLEAGQMTDYISGYPREYNITVYAEGTTDEPLLDKTISINKNSSYTAVIAGERLDLSLLKENKQEIPPFREAVVTYTNFAPIEGAVDIYISDGTILYKDLSFGESMPSILIFPTDERFFITYTGTDDVIASTPTIQLQRATYYSLFSVLEGNEIKLNIDLNGLNYLALC